MSFKAPRGTNDFTPPESERIERLEEISAGVFRRFGLRPIRTPMFEPTELFTRNIGETSDVVVKEMYTFQDRKGRSLTLRPEGTAPVVRALVERSLLQGGQDRLYYVGAEMFRYERPQAGRYRQHHQVGVEVFGDPSPECDVEVIDCMVQVLRALGLDGLEVKVNSVGSPDSRARYGEALREYLEPRKDQLPEVCRERLERNPMRILDEKAPGVRALLQDAPKFDAFMDQADKQHHERVIEGLEMLGIPIEKDPYLVRGFDYYNRTAFEVVTTALGAQDAVGGGGRYDLLVKDVGGPDTPGVGFAMGEERLLLLLEEMGREPPRRVEPPRIYLACLDEEAREEALVLASQLRKGGVPCLAGYRGGKPLKQFQRAEKLGCAYAVVLGSKERERGVLGLRDLATRVQQDVAPSELVDHIQRSWATAMQAQQEEAAGGE